MGKEIDDVLERVRTSFESRAPFAEDREHAAELVAQARPMVRAFVGGFERSGSEGWDNAGEAYSMLNLLGRHLGERGLTPGAAMIGCDLLFFELREIEIPVQDVETGLTFRGVFVEGYVGGVQALQTRVHQNELERSQVRFSTPSGTCVLMLSGPLRAETIERVGEDFGRFLFRRDATSAVVHLGALGGSALSRDVFDAVLAIDEQARTLGCRCIFSGVSREQVTQVFGDDTRLELLEFAASLDGLLDGAPTLQGDGARLRTVLRRIDSWLAAKSSAR